MSINIFSARRDDSIAVLQVAMLRTKERVTKLENELQSVRRRIEAYIAAQENTMRGEDYDKLNAKRRRMNTPPVAPVDDLLFSTEPGAVNYGIHRNLFGGKVRPEVNTLLEHFDHMPEGDTFWALLNLLDRREVRLCGFKLSSKNLRRLRRDLQKMGVDVRKYAEDPS